MRQTPLRSSVFLRPPPGEQRCLGAVNLALVVVAWMILMAATPWRAQAQGAVLFANISLDLTREKLVRNAATGGLLGSDFVAQLFAGQQGAQADELVAVDNSTTLMDLPNPSGLFLGPALVIPGVEPGGTASLEVRVYRHEYSSWLEALAAARVDANALMGRSGVFRVVLGTERFPAEIVDPMPAFAISVIPEPGMTPLILAAAWLVACHRQRRQAIS